MVTEQVQHFSIILTSLEPWKQLKAQILHTRALLNYSKPVRKLEQRLQELMVLKLSCTASGQVWNVYLLPLLCYVEQLFIPPAKI